jgi:hypothetical protein
MRNLTPYLLAAAFMLPGVHVSAQATKGIKSLLPDPKVKAKEQLEKQSIDLEKRVAELGKSKYQTDTGSLEKNINATEKQLGSAKKLVEAGIKAKGNTPETAALVVQVRRAELNVEKAKKAVAANNKKSVKPAPRGWSER